MDINHANTEPRAKVVRRRKAPGNPQIRRHAIKVCPS
jgi:hypothetical protein